MPAMATSKSKSFRPRKMADDPPADPYAAARANVRDTVKWLATALAATAAAALGSSPLTGLGSLPMSSPRFHLAGIAVIIALFGILGAIGVILNLLLGEIFSLEASASLPWVIDFIEPRKNDILPPGYDSLGALLKARRNHADHIAANAGDKTSQAYRDAVADYQSLQPALAAITQQVHLEYVLRSVRSARWPLAGLSIVAGIALVCYAWAANPPKPPDAGPTPPHIHGQ
jgi:hypothetical protein